MDVLSNLFGSLTSGIIRLLVVVGVLAASYFFIVKPVLHTTDEAIKNSGLNEIGKTLKGVSKEVRHQVNHSFHVTKQQGGNPQKLLHCVQNANGDVNKMQRCTRRF